MWSEKEQFFRMRWVLFWIFAVVFCVIVAATLLVVFFNIGAPHAQERGLLFDVFVLEIGVAIVVLFYSIFGLKRSEENGGKIKGNQLSDEGVATKLAKQISATGITNFFPSRDFYPIFRPQASSIDKYIETARQSLVIVSINLMTGLTFDGLCRIFKQKLENKSMPVSVVVSLLNPWKEELMSAISPVLDMNSEKLSDDIKNTLKKLINFRDQLPLEARGRFEIRTHNAIPFGSAIMIDHHKSDGRIQIETKPYKVPIRRSFAFEVAPKGQKEGLFSTLWEGYEALLRDGQIVESGDFAQEKL